MMRSRGSRSRGRYSLKYANPRQTAKQLESYYSQLARIAKGLKMMSRRVGGEYPILTDYLPEASKLADQAAGVMEEAMMEFDMEEGDTY